MNNKLFEIKVLSFKIQKYLKMCGIYACFYRNKDGGSVENQEKCLADKIRKRGPDSTTMQITKDFEVCFHRLAINDLSENGNQPFYSDDQSVMVMCNGEIYNFKELAELYHLKLNSNSDCEIILRLYEKNVLNVKDFNGDFAFIIFDKNKELILAARDRIGVRPLFFGFRTKDRKEVVFCSEVKGMTDCIDIEHIKPGQLYTFATNHFFSSPFCQLSPQSTLMQNADKDVLRTLLFNATKIRLLSERPIGCLLSGGLDSSIICAILCACLGSENVRTYSIGMQGSLDLQYAKKVATFLGTKHTEVLFTPQEGWDIIPEVIYHLESYDITTVRASVGMYLLSKYIKENTDDKVIFSGEGSDELFCGYLYFHYAPSAKAAHAESIQLLEEMYKYDALRADRCVSSHGLELRVPFLDVNVIEYATQLSPEQKVPRNGMEKKLLREAFEGYLPEEVLNRRKDGFSDGVSGKEKSWYEYIAEYVKGPVEKEKTFYKDIFYRHFPQHYQPIEKYWLPKWIECNGNPSGRVLSVFD